MRHLARTAGVAAALFGAAVALAGCTFATPTSPPDATEAPVGQVTSSPPPTPDVTAVAEDAVFGRWRRAPAHPSPAILHASEQACRAQPAAGTLPLLVTDARGEGQLTLVFAGPKAATVCHATVAQDGSATADARAIAGYPDKAPAAQKLGVHDVEIIDATTGARTVVVGQVGDGVSRVAAQFDDATWSNASMAGGWYALWWPGRDPALTIAAVNSRSEAVDGFSP
jgi:hypothetical protein